MKSGFIRQITFDGFIFAYFCAVIVALTPSADSDQSLQLGSNAAWFVVALCMGAVLSFALSRAKNSRLHTLGKRLFAPDSKISQPDPNGWYQTLSGWQLLGFVAVTFLVGMALTRVSASELLDRDGFDGAMRLFNGLFHPNFQILPRAVLNIIETIFMAFMATFLAIPAAFMLSFLCARNLMKTPAAFGLYVLLRAILNFIRAIEALIWAIIFSVWVGIGPFAGMLALMIHSVASLTKQYSEMLETVALGPIEAIESTGATKLQTLWFAVVPQVLLPYISFTIYRWDINVRMATIIGLVGGGGIGTMLIQYQGQAMWPEVGCIILVIGLVVWGMDQASSALREALK
jgi:phosphonate transport system permease protein